MARNQSLGRLSWLLAAALLAFIFAPSTSSAKGLASREKYCAVDPQHTACRFSKVNETGACGKIIERSLTPFQKGSLLAALNQHRRNVARGALSPQPPASNMIYLTWNNEAAAIAQLWVDQCTFTADAARQTVKRNAAGIPNGQNRFLKLGEGFQVQSAVNAWIAEVAALKPTEVKAYVANPATANYTQAVWASTASVGCGYILAGDSHFLACNFAPAGNIVGEPVYKNGSSCTACPPTHPKCVVGLCAAV